MSVGLTIDSEQNIGHGSECILLSDSPYRNKQAPKSLRTFISEDGFFDYNVIVQQHKFSISPALIVHIKVTGKNILNEILKQIQNSTPTHINLSKLHFLFTIRCSLQMMSWIRLEKITQNLHLYEIE
jgi:hypothetical protein